MKKSINFLVSLSLVVFGLSLLLSNNSVALAASIPTCPKGTAWMGNRCVNIATTGTITASPSSCIIRTNNSTCNINLKWNVSQPESAYTSSIYSDYPFPNTITLVRDSGTKVISLTALSAGRTFYLYNNNKILSQVTVTASCEKGSIWNGRKCTTVPVK